MLWFLALCWGTPEIQTVCRTIPMENVAQCRFVENFLQTYIETRNMQAYVECRTPRSAA